MNIILIRKYLGVVTDIYGPFADEDKAWDRADSIKARFSNLGIDQFVLSQTEFYISRLQG